MTKSTKPSTELPAVIEICDYAGTAFARAAVLIRDFGYVFDPTNSPVAFIHSGQTAITLVQGEHSERAIAEADAAIASALQSQKAAQERAELKALELARESEERAAKQAELAEQIAAAKTQLKKLEKAHNAL